MHPIFHFSQTCRINEKFQVGSPLPKGIFFATQALALVDTNNRIIDAHIKAVQLWPDHSIKWLNIEGILNTEIAPNEQLFLTSTPQTPPVKRNDWVKKEDKQLIVSTKNSIIQLRLDRLFASTIDEHISLNTEVDLHTQQLLKSEQATNVQTQYEVVFTSLQQPLLCKVTQTAVIPFKKSNEASSASNVEKIKDIKISANLVIYYADTSIFANLSLHNPNAIVHHDGQWDLGNENSVIVSKFATNLNYESSKTFLQLDANQAMQNYDSLELTQFSSGGDNWDSENHVGSSNLVELKRRGAKGNILLGEAETTIDIDRPSPFIQIVIDNINLNFSPHHFWQKYPNGISSNQTKTSIDFADKRSGCLVELQPGEIKSHDLALSLSNINEDIQKIKKTLRLDTQYVLNSQNIEMSNAIPFVGKLLCKHPLFNSVSGDTKNNWYNKRELVDQYGWRNYGDLYADHEAAEYKGNGIFVSHYNNQYDPLFGFIKQWLVTQDTSFKKLADDLFDHLIHIDIYHTNDDKPEYNQGLFWHTDHYVPAKTATHRTYSKHQETGVYMDHAGGGGPGAHHCYSSGIALYYLITGDERAKQATIGLAKWMTSIYEGDGTILGLILRAKNTNHLTIPFSNKLLFGAGTGIVRNIFTNAYPLDRGTGNYVNVLLDCFETTLQKAYFDKSEYVILNTIDKKDDISERNFEDIENTWYYVVFLQAVAKYLAIVSQQISRDSSAFVDLGRVAAIYDAFVHYATYMAERETTYLENADVLEYPNDTWVGQDLRKIYVLFCGYELTKNPDMLNKANQLAEVTYSSLLNSKERTYARIQALIMQNYVCLGSISSGFGDLSYILDQYKQENKNERDDIWPQVNKSYFFRCIKFIRSYSIKKEINMLCVRIPFIKKVLNK